MIKITYLLVPVDCVRDQGLLLDDFLVSCILNLRYRSCPTDELLHCLSVSTSGCSRGSDAPLLLVWPLLICTQHDFDLLDQTAN